MQRTYGNHSVSHVRSIGSVGSYSQKAITYVPTLPT